MYIGGGESIYSYIDDLLRSSGGLDPSNAVTVAPPLEGMEKLRAMAGGGIGNGDAAFDVTKLFRAESW